MGWIAIAVAGLTVTAALIAVAMLVGRERRLRRRIETLEQAEREHTEISLTLQRGLLPSPLPHIPGWSIAAMYRPAGAENEVGGDFYDVFQVGEGDWVVAIGDVCGKGVDAAVVTAVARYTVRAAVVQVDAPSRALAILNDVLLRHETERFCTVTILRLRERDTGWTATVSSGGHPSPLLARGSDGTEWFGPEGSLVGVVDAPDFADAETPLRPGDTLVLYTDGVTEARRGKEFFGEERLLATVTACPPGAQAVADTVVARVVDFQLGDARDDIAVVAVRVPAPGG